MKKIYLLGLLLVALNSFSQREDPYIWTVSNPDAGSYCVYDVCLKLALQEISTSTIISSQWICETVLPGMTASYSLNISPASGYQIVVIGAKATFNSTTIGLNPNPSSIQFYQGSCSGDQNSQWVTGWESTGPRSYNISESVIVGR